MNTNTRYKVTIIAAFFLAALALLSVAMKMETVAVTSVTGILTILSAYIWAQTKRPSNNDLSNQNNNNGINANSDTTGVEQDQ